MKPNHWLKKIRKRMLLAGLPLSYVDRSIGELCEHFNDLRQHHDQATALSQLGERPEQLADFFRSSYQDSRWYRRVPNWMWFLVPFLLNFAVCLFWYVGGLILLDSLLEISNNGSSPVRASTFMLVAYLGKLITPFVATFLLFRLLSFGSKSQRLQYWLAGVLSLMFILTSTELQLPESDPDYSFTISFDAEGLWAIGNPIWEFFQAAIVILLSVWQYIRNQHELNSPFVASRQSLTPNC